MAVITNYVTNPSIEVDVTGWTPDGGVTRSRITSDAFAGTAALQLILDGTTTQGIVSSASAYIPALPGQTWTVSVYGKSSDVAQMRVVLGEYSSVPAFLRQTNGSLISLTGTHARMKATATLGASAAYVAIIVRTPSGDAGTVVLDAFMATQTSDVVDYFDGDTTDEGGFVYDWTGTANASTSTRTSLGLSASAKLRRSNFELRPAY